MSAGISDSQRRRWDRRRFIAISFRFQLVTGTAIQGSGAVRVRVQRVRFQGMKAGYVQRSSEAPRCHGAETTPNSGAIVGRYTVPSRSSRRRVPSANTRASTLFVVVLTEVPSSHRLIAVHRVLALLLVPALLSTSGLSFALHTHVYTDHDHPEHHHGLSAHHHDGTPTRGAEGTARLDTCDPAQHTVSFAFACAALPQSHAADAAVVLSTSLTPELQIEPAVGNPDVRVHGPPSRTQASPRAPPLKFLA